MGQRETAPIHSAVYLARGDKLSARTLGLSGEIWNAQLCISRTSSSSSRSSDLTPPTGQTLEQDVGIGAGQMMEEVHDKEMLEEDQEEMSEEDQEKKHKIGEAVTQM